MKGFVTERKHLLLYSLCTGSLACACINGQSKRRDEIPFLRVCDSGFFALEQHQEITTQGAIAERTKAETSSS